MTTFNKDALPVAEQIALLQQRGLIINDTAAARNYLNNISYFRLSAYMRPFQCDDHHTFQTNVNFQQIVDLYAFDRELRLLLMDAIERFEVAVRAAIGNHMGPLHGAHWYLDAELYRNQDTRIRLIQELTKKMEKERSQLDRDLRHINNSKASNAAKQQRKENRTKENYLRFYLSKYDTPAQVPSWAMLEEVSLGQLSHLFKDLAHDSDRKDIARQFNVPQIVLESWLHTLTFVRNCCAHHSRIWNRELSIVPKLPKSQPWCSIPAYIPTLEIQPRKRLFIVIAMLHHLMQQVAPNSSWLSRVEDLLLKYPRVNTHFIGFPDHWRDHVQ